MKYLPFLLLIVACQQPTTQTVPVATPSTSSSPSTVTATTTPTPTPTPLTTITTTTTHVMNSLWQEVTVTTVNSVSPVKSLARDASVSIGFVNLQNSVNQYNSTHVNDQWFIVDGQVPDLADAPPCDVFIVDKVTHIPITYPDGNGGTISISHTNWPRKSLVDNYSGFEKDAIAANGDLYIDVIPPAPTPPTADQVFAAHQVYVINNIGAIKYHFDCSVVPSDWSTTPTTIDQYFYVQLNRANLIVQTDGIGQVDSPWTVVSGQVYTAP